MCWWLIEDQYLVYTECNDVNVSIIIVLVTPVCLWIEDKLVWKAKHVSAFNWPFSIAFECYICNSMHGSVIWQDIAWVGCIVFSRVVSNWNYSPQVQCLTITLPAIEWCFILYLPLDGIDVFIVYFSKGSFANDSKQTSTSCCAFLLWLLQIHCAYMVGMLLCNIMQSGLSPVEYHRIFNGKTLWHIY